MTKVISIILGFIVLCIVYICIICIDPINIILYTILLFLILGLSIFGYFISILTRTSGINNPKKTLKILENKKIYEKNFKNIICRLLFSMGFDNIEVSKDTLADFVCDKTYFLVRLKNINEELIKEAQKEKEKLNAQTYIIISFEEFTDYNLLDTITFWDKNRILANVRNLIPHTNNIHPEIKIEKLTIGDLDFSSKDNFEKECNKLLSLYYEYVKKENDFYIYNIDSKKYGVLFVRADKEKLNQKNMEEIFSKIYAQGYSNALVITNGYYSDGIKEMSKKLQIDLWNRDNLIYMINK